MNLTGIKKQYMDSRSNEEEKKNKHFQPVKHAYTNLHTLKSDIYYKFFTYLRMKNRITIVLKTNLYYNFVSIIKNTIFSVFFFCSFIYFLYLFNLFSSSDMSRSQHI